MPQPISLKLHQLFNSFVLDILYNHYPKNLFPVKLLKGLPVHVEFVKISPFDQLGAFFAIPLMQGIAYVTFQGIPS